MLPGIDSTKKIDIGSLNDFKNASANWYIAGDATVDLNKKDILFYTAGKGMLINMPTGFAREDLYTNFKHGNLDIELDYMMAKGFNNGIYLQSQSRKTGPAMQHPWHQCHKY